MNVVTGVEEAYRPALALGKAQWIILCQRGYRPSVQWFL